MDNNFLTGFAYVGKGFRLIFKPGVKRFVVIPFLINLVIFSAAIYWGYGQMSDWLSHSLPGWLNWLRWLIMPVFIVTASIIVFYTFTLLANLIAAPFNSALSEKIETHLSGNKNISSGNLLSIAKEIPVTIFSELKKLAYLGLWIIPLLILFIIPGVNIIAPVAWGLFSMWMLALEYTDYPMGNNGFSFAQEKSLLKQYKWLAWGFGGGILLITFIPILNFFAMPVGVAGATALWVEKLRNKSGSR
ncbi:MAG TPA: sulfate transporter CysZ [Chromatiales bacterium]|nr:sulfate transporter CysZ [Thiotrichales bacterium]HIP68359.1 sulfate transporter CysZ [Chromatiales bacterium]